MKSERKIRVLLSKLGLDAHDIGVRVVAKGLRDAGMEVIYLGSYQTPEKVVATALQEDVDVIGLSFLGGTQMILVPRVLSLLKEKNAANIPVVIGGVIPPQDIPPLKEMGIKEVFREGCAIESIVGCIEELVMQKERR